MPESNLIRLLCLHNCSSLLTYLFVTGASRFFSCRQDHDTPLSKLSSDFLPQTTHQVQAAYLFSSSSPELSASFVTLQQCWPWWPWCGSLNCHSSSSALLSFSLSSPGVLYLGSLSHGWGVLTLSALCSNFTSLELLSLTLLTLSVLLTLFFFLTLLTS